VSVSYLSAAAAQARSRYCYGADTRWLSGYLFTLTVGGLAAAGHNQLPRLFIATLESQGARYPHPAICLVAFSSAPCMPYH